MLTVNEIFHSIQGESTRAGDPCVFVRLTACDLRCTWCDTPYAFHEGRKMSIDDVLSAVDGYGCPLVEITGGEPLLQDDVYPLMERLLDGGHTVMLETGGHRPIDRVPRRRRQDRRRQVSRAAASPTRTDWRNLDRLAPHDEVKFVIADRADYEFARDVVCATSCRRARRRSCFRRSTAGSTRRRCPNGCSPIACPSACSFSSTSSSGRRPPAACEHLVMSSSVTDHRFEILRLNE